ncbi:MAG: peroxiredoxin [Anaerolineae bacterium]|nr:peroxiredoxin [Anaerolineae bacterium]
MARVSKPAPSFTVEALVDGKVKSVSLADYRGKWVVLFFYPGDFTFVCPTELVAVAERYQEFKDRGVEVLSLSVDSPYVHKAWQEHELSKMIEGGLPYPMLSDRAGRVGNAYLVYDADSGVDLRGMFIIDPDGILQVAEVLNESMGRDVEEMLRLLQGSQYVYSRRGEALPACWKPGQATLKPGEELVGKIWDTWKL